MPDSFKKNHTLLELRHALVMSNSLPFVDEEGRLKLNNSLLTPVIFRAGFTLSPM